MASPAATFTSDPSPSHSATPPATSRQVAAFSGHSEPGSLRQPAPLGADDRLEAAGQMEIRVDHGRSGPPPCSPPCVVMALISPHGTLLDDRVCRTARGPEAFLGIRAARESDLAEILAIYNHAVVNTTATFDLDPRSAEAQQAWFLEHVPPHPAIVWDEEGRILGWASLSPYASRCAYRFAGEASVYVAPDARRAGIGEALLRELVGAGRGERAAHAGGPGHRGERGQLRAGREGRLPAGGDARRGRLQVRPLAERDHLPVPL